MVDVYGLIHIGYVIAFGCVLPTTGQLRDFHPLECALAERTIKDIPDVIGYVNEKSMGQKRKLFKLVVEDFGFSNRSCRRRIQLSACETQNHLRFYPRSVLNAAGFLMRKVSLIRSQTSSQEAVSCAGFLNPIVHDGTKMIYNSRSICHRC